MHIGISAHFWPQITAGSGQYLRHLVGELARLETDHTLTMIGEPGAFAGDTPPLPAVEVPRGFLPGGRPAKMWFEQVAVSRLARTLRLDLLHIPYVAPPLLCPIPTVVTVHDLIPILLPAYRGSWRKRAYTWLALRATRRARAIIAVSEYTRQDTIRHLRYPQDRVFVTHEAAAPGMSPAPPEAIAALRRRYDLPERFVLHLGNTDRRKGAHRLLGAFAGWRDAGGRKDTSLVIAGPHHEPDGKLFLDLPSLARSLGVEESVRFLGPIPEEEKAALYSAATVFALLSEYEGFGLPPLECMACGTPVMVAATTSLPEVVGEAGLLVELADEQGIAAALGRLLEDDAWRAELRQRGLEHAGRFSWARTARETMAVYERVLSTPSHEKLPSPGS